MNVVENSTIEKFEYKAEMKRLLHLIINSLYSHPEVFLRELVSNASDALNKIRLKKLVGEQFENSELELAIRINIEPETGKFSIEDTGIGMNKDDLVERIGTIASSGTIQFLEELNKQNKKNDSELIGQFGVGFYSVFMVTDEVKVDTLYYQSNSEGLRWTSGTENNYTIEPIKKTKRGTKISFKFKDEHKQLCSESSIKNILRKYSNFVNFPIYLNNERINIVSAIWHKKKDDIKEEELNEFYTYLTNDYNKPLGHLHINIEGNINFKALLFIFERAPAYLFREISDKTLHLYSNRVFIQDSAQEILPEYLRFVKGVIDTEDLPLNVSRETTQTSPHLIKIKNILTSKILAFLEEWSITEKVKYDKFFLQFGTLLKTGLNTDFANKDKILSLLKFESTELPIGELTSINGYISRMKPDQDEIYYTAGNSRELLVQNPNLEYFKSKNIEVLFFTDPVDLFTMPYVNIYEGKKIVSIEKAYIKEETTNKDTSDTSNSMLNSLIITIKNILGDKIEDVKISHRLVNSAITLVSGEHGMDFQMEKMMKIIDKEYSETKKVMEINPNNTLIKNLAKINIQNSEDKALIQIIEQLYEGALLIDGNIKNPVEFVNNMNKLLELATINKLK